MKRLSYPRTLISGGARPPKMCIVSNFDTSRVKQFWRDRGGQSYRQIAMIGRKTRPSLSSTIHTVSSL